ncbi:MAG: phosphoribosyl-ATP diphosphatase [bacterium]|nr:phosphoribosyl-ATP diphosphatase [Deltaproteobacteria bacterium]MCP4908669.1 phosphoribosyl-ATP diphosphatase [bacterium]
MVSNHDGTGRGGAPTATVLDRLFEVVTARRDQRPEGSYVRSLLDGGWAAIEAKVREEAQEVVDAARDESDQALAHEAADLLFHLWVMLASRGLEPAAVYAELERRFGIGGHEEKTARAARGAEQGKDDEV